MTDADVDGSHIRTSAVNLLLSSNARIDRARLYLYCPTTLIPCKTWKTRQYLKDDRALNEYLIQIALEDAQLFVNPTAPAITGTALEKIARQYMSVMDIIHRLSRRYPSAVMEALIDVPRIAVSDLQSLEVMESWVSKL